MNPIDHRMVVAVLGSLGQLDPTNARSLSLADAMDAHPTFYSPRAKDTAPKPWYREHGNKRRIYK